METAESAKAAEGRVSCVSSSSRELHEKMPPEHFFAFLGHVATGGLHTAPPKIHTASHSKLEWALRPVFSVGVGHNQIVVTAWWVVRSAPENQIGPWLPLDRAGQ